MGPIYEFFSSDHRRLERLLRHATAARDRIDAEAFSHFRAGLLRHIGMEEKVLLPAAREAREGVALPLAHRLRLDHGAIASLLVPTPGHAVVNRLLSVLEPHNIFEEKPGGLYETCDELLQGRTGPIQEKLRAFPEVPLAPHNDSPLVEQTIENAIRLARESWDEN